LITEKSIDIYCVWLRMQIARHQWLTPVILATQEAEFRTNRYVRSYLEKNPSQKTDGGVAQGEGPEFNSQYHKKKCTC
jgi:hypothetical protein